MSSAPSEYGRRSIMTKRHTNTVVGASHIVLSRDGTKVGYLSWGAGPSVLVIPGVLSMAADYAELARASAEHFTVHIIERQGRGESGASLLVGHSYGGLVALEVARNNKAFAKIVNVCVREFKARAASSLW
jgi:pimeloyl-ACP methyl ester carboxylesterase